MQFIKEYKFTIVVTAIILIAILMPPNDIPSVGIPYIDKLVHCSMFGGLTLSFYGEYYYKHKGYPKELYAVMTIMLYAAVTEVLQNFVPGRSCDAIDWIADTVGILLAVRICHIGINYYKNKWSK